MLLAQAVQTVHTSGLNIESLATILAGFATVVAVLIGFVSRRLDKRDAQHAKEVEELRRDFTEGLTHMAEVLNARLETKEAVSGISSRLARVEGALAASTVQSP
jgi:uncharacterized membrane-anchored protein YhcB (DUF1043 family)